MDQVLRKNVLRTIFKALAVLMAMALAAVSLGLTVARMTLPATACTVTQAQIKTLELEKMSYAAVAAKFGCGGIISECTDFGAGLVIETYSWQGEAWPYARFDGRFINRQLHGTKTVWLNLNATR